MNVLFLFCCKSCLKGDDTSEYYTILELEKSRSLTTDDIKKAYKKASLNLHPDKLAQRGVTQTAEHKHQFLQVKEAYDVLSDPKRRKLYDEIGASGLKLIESPQSLNPADLIKNFQNNRKDRCSVGLIVALIFASLFVLPVLFSLKCDGTLDSSVPWTAIWTPMWIVDCLFLIVAFLIFAPKQDSVNEDGETIPADEIPMQFKLFNLCSTVAFVLIQVFVLMRLDDSTHWNWFAVFAPWFVYESLWFCSVIPKSIATVPRPDVDTLKMPSLEALETGEGQEAMMQRMTAEAEYFEKILEQVQARKSAWMNLLNIWQAIFLAVQLNHSVHWNWGLVFLPMWLHLLTQCCTAYSLRRWGKAMGAGIDPAAVEIGLDRDPMSVFKLEHSKELLTAASGQCFFQLAPLLMAVLLVSRLQSTSAHISTFIIILPVFLVLGCCCLAVFCGIVCIAFVDTDSFEQELAGTDPAAAQGQGQGQADSADASNVTIVLEEQPPSSASNNNSGSYGSFGSTGNAPAATAAVSSDSVPGSGSGKESAGRAASAVAASQDLLSFDESNQLQAPLLTSTEQQTSLGDID